MIDGQHKYLIDCYLQCFIRTHSGHYDPNNDTIDKDIRKIKDLKLHKNIPSDEVHEYIIQKLVASNCSADTIKHFFSTSAL
jgi:hypothetical protein